MTRYHSAEYEQVLSSERWRALRLEVIRLAGYRCIACGGALDVHHAYGYRNLGNERPEELQALCRSCHEFVHTQSRVIDAGCLRTLVWIVLIAIGLELAWWLLTSTLHYLGVS